MKYPQTVLGLLVVVGIALPAGAAEIEEIVVTATKRGETDVQSLPEAVYALGAETMQLRRQFDFEHFAASVPGLQFQDLGPGDKEYIIRGINGNGPSVVGAYFDEYVITANDQQDGGGKNIPIKLVDMERVEVLNGPQGTLYGANSMAGNIRFISRKPDSQAFDAFVDGDVSSTSEGGENYLVSGALNVPIAQGESAMRFVGYYEDDEGWIDQPRRERGSTFALDDDINSIENYGGRVALRWTPGEDVTLDLLYAGQRMDVGGSSRFTAEGVPAWPDQPPEIASIPGNTGFAPLPGLPSLTPSDDYVNADVTTSMRDDDFDLFGLTVAYDAGHGTFSLAASKVEHDIVFHFDSTPILLFFNAPVVGITTQPQTYETLMAEGRYSSRFEGPVNFVTGIYYQKDENDFEVRVTTTDGMGNDVPWDPLNANDTFINNGTAIFGRFRNDEIEQEAIFGEATWQFAERWQLLAGFRWFQADIDSIQATTHGFLGAVGPPAGEIIGETVNGNGIGLITQSDETVTPKISLSFQATDDVMFYALYSEGFRVGGVNNANQPFAMGIPATFDSDELSNFEFGVKSLLLDRRLLLNATAFFVDWRDIQVEPRDPAGNIPFTTNGGAAEVNGIEWKMEARPTERLTLDFTGTYFFDHALTEDQPVLPGASPFVVVGREGDDIPNTPDLQLYGSVRYDAQLGRVPVSFIADVTYRDKTNTEFDENNPFNIELDSYTLVDLFVNADITEHFTLGGYARNVTDEVAVYDGIGTFQDPEAIVAARPLTIGIVGRYRF